MSCQPDSKQVRTRNLEPPLDLSAYEGLELRVKGDGLRYKLVLRSESAWDGIGYTASFDTTAGAGLGIVGVMLVLQVLASLAGVPFLPG